MINYTYLYEQAELQCRSLSWCQSFAADKAKGTVLFETIMDIARTLEAELVRRDLHTDHTAGDASDYVEEILALI